MANRIGGSEGREVGCSGGQHGSSRRLCLVLVAGWAGVVGCILAAHDFLPYRELQMSGGSRTSSRSEGTLNGEGHLLGDVGRKRGSVGPTASLLHGHRAWCRAGLSHFPGLAGEGALCPVTSALCLWPLQSHGGSCLGSGNPDPQPVPDCMESFLGR